MILRPLTNENVPGTLLLGTGTFLCPSRKIAVLASADSTNAATFTLRKNNVNGDVIFYYASKNPIWVPGPITTGVDLVYYAVTGTAATAMFYEWID